jgi:undecaprenyl-diphosphatase
MRTTTTNAGHDTRSILEPTPTRRLDAVETAPHPVRAGLQVAAQGYAVLTMLMLGIGVFLTHVVDRSVGGWDNDVNRWFVGHRSAAWDHVTAAATWAVNTVPVVAFAAVVVGVLWWRHRVREAAFLTTALVVEITVFLSVTFVIDRPRPDVPRLNSTPSTSSFPSGHTAAATVLFAGLALIVMCCTHNRALRAVSVVGAIAIAVTVGFGRVYRGLHHPTDVFAGALLGIGCLTVAALAVRAASARAELRDQRADKIDASPRSANAKHARAAAG